LFYLPQFGKYLVLKIVGEVSKAETKGGGVKGLAAEFI
jgi:hypothetical protein